MSDLIKSNKKFIEEMKMTDEKYFEELSKGQSPDYFVLACADSRVSPSVVTNLSLGNLFVHRNVANQVAEDDESFATSLYYALVHLKVKKVIIKGHTNCGGVAAAWDDNQEDGLVNWLSKIKESFPSKEENEHLTSTDLSKLNVLKQVENVKNHPIYKKYGDGVEVVGALFHLENGELEELINE
jgi:carbonic anhydrase